MILNPKLLVLENENDSVLLKVGKANDIIKMSIMEFKIITNYSETTDFNSVQENFKDDIEIEKNQMDFLIGKAIENKILIAKNSSQDSNWGINFILKKNKKI